MSTDLEKQPGAELTAQQEQDLIAKIVGKIDESDLVLPAIKITQQMTTEVAKGNVPAGIFLNTVTGEEYGSTIEFVVVDYNRGRFYVANRGEDNEQSYVASGEVAPDNWPEEFAGKVFADIPEAEEQHKARSNAGEIPWGRGPAIVTTHNFVGFVKTQGEDGEVEYSAPARLGLSRTSAPAAQKILSTMRFGGKAPWANAYKLTLNQDEKGGKVYYSASAVQGSQSDAPTVAHAQKLAVLVAQSGEVRLDGSEVDDADKPAAAPATPEGGVKI